MRTNGRTFAVGELFFHSPNCFALGGFSIVAWKRAWAKKSSGPCQRVEAEAAASLAAASSSFSNQMTTSTLTDFS